MDAPDYAELLEHAQGIASRMSHDPEVLSLAGLAVIQAVKTHDPTRFKTPMKKWLGRIVRQHVWDYWRKEARRREVEELRPDVWWETEQWIANTYKIRDTIDFDDEDRETLQMMYENRIDQWCLDVVARRHNTTVYDVKKRMRAVEARMEKHLA